MNRTEKLNISRSPPVSYIPPNLTVSGDDKRWYIYRVAELIKYLKK